MINTEFFEICDSFQPRRWHLGTPVDAAGQEIDPRIFTEAKRVDISDEIFLPVTSGELPLDFTLGAFDMPVVHKRVAVALEELGSGAIQRIPAVVEPQRDCYEILNVINAVPCLDDQNSEIIWWTTDDGRPERIGTYRRVGKKVLRREVVQNHRIFRIKGWLVALIVHEEVKLQLETLCVSGIRFKPLIVA